MRKDLNHITDLLAAFRESGMRRLSALFEIRPKVVSWFSGRDEELVKLKEILGVYGSVAITGYGGLGKTQLMSALASGAQEDGIVPGWPPTCTGPGRCVHTPIQDVVHRLSVSLSPSYRKEPT